MDTESPTRVHLQLIDVDQRALVPFTRWLDEEWLPRAVVEGGWSRGRRFVCHQEPQLHLMLLDGKDDKARPPRLAPHSSLGRRWVRSFMSHTFCQSSGASVAPGDDDPRFVNAIITQTTKQGAAAFDRWYDDVHVPEILRCPGWESARRFRAEGDSPVFLALYHLSDPELPFQSAQYEQAVGWDDVEHVLQGYHGFRTYVRAHVYPEAEL